MLKERYKLHFILHKMLPVRPQTSFKYIEYKSN